MRYVLVLPLFAFAYVVAYLCFAVVYVLSRQMGFMLYIISKNELFTHWLTQRLNAPKQPQVWS